MIFLAVGELRPIFIKLCELRHYCNLILGELRPIIWPISITKKTPREGWPYGLPKM